MKIKVDSDGWAAEPCLTDEPTPSEHALPPDPVLKPSGVYLKIDPAALAHAEDFARAPTEPCPPSDEAMAESAFRLPAPPSVPRDFDVASDDGTKVA